MDNTLISIIGSFLSAALGSYIVHRLKRKAKQEDKQEQLIEEEIIARYEERKDIRKILEARVTFLEARCEIIQKQLLERIENDAVKTERIRVLEERVQLLENDLETAYARVRLYEATLRSHGIPIPHFRRNGDPSEE